MHTHSEFSHDSSCKIEDMLLSQMAKGTSIFAVTDHCDTASYADYDIYTPIRTAYETVEALNEKYRGKCRALAGVEIGEGFLYPEECRRMLSLVRYDVVIGSVHIVKYGEITRAYSSVDFSEYSPEVIDGFMSQYFDDVITMIGTVDIDILAHLTCPIRYIKGKYNINVDMSKYNGKIERILKLMIEKKIALEANTSSYSIIGESIPSESIFETYYRLGGRMVTLGSDAHSVGGASAGFDKALEMLKRVGFTEILYYEKRKPHALKI